MEMKLLPETSVAIGWMTLYKKMKTGTQVKIQSSTFQKRTRWLLLTASRWKCGLKRLNLCGVLRRAADLKVKSTWLLHVFWQPRNISRILRYTFTVIIVEVMWLRLTVICIETYSFHRCLYGLASPWRWSPNWLIWRQSTFAIPFEMTKCRRQSTVTNWGWVTNISLSESERRAGISGFYLEVKVRGMNV